MPTWYFPDRKTAIEVSQKLSNGYADQWGFILCALDNMGDPDPPPGLFGYWSIEVTFRLRCCREGEYYEAHDYVRVGHGPFIITGFDPA